MSESQRVAKPVESGNVWERKVGRNSPLGRGGDWGRVGEERLGIELDCYAWEWRGREGQRERGRE